jgi:hypothetical protein
MAELICKDGTRIRISNETEQELREAFEPQQETFRLGDIFFRKVYPQYLQLVEDEKAPYPLTYPCARVGLRPILTKTPDTLVCDSVYVRDKKAITMREVQRMTVFPGEMRKVNPSKLAIIEQK